MKQTLFSLGLLFCIACGSSSQEVKSASDLPTADPQAVRYLVSGARAMKSNTPAGNSRAKKKFLEALELDDQLWEAEYNLGVLSRRAGDLDEAIDRFERAKKIFPAGREPNTALAESHYASGNAKKAASVLQEYVEAHPESLADRVRLASLYRELSSYNDALSQAREVLVRDSSFVPALLEVGRIYRSKKQYDVSSLVLQKALALVKKDDNQLAASVHNEQGLLELARGDTQQAFLAFGLAAEKDPRFAPARLNMGAVLLSAGDYKGAETEYRAVLKSDDNNLDARVALGASLRGQGEHNKAKREYSKVLQVEKEHLGALFNMAVLEADFLDKRPKARTRFLRFMKLAPRNHPKREDAQRYIEEIPAPKGSPGGAS